MSWQKVKLGDFLKERKGLLEPNDPLLFTMKKIEKLDFANGKIFLTQYSPTKTKQIIVYPNDFVFSGLNIEKGAVTINTTNEKLVVSANYSTCEVDYNIIDQEFFLLFMKSNVFKAKLKKHLKKDYGFTRPKHLDSLEFEIPVSLTEQREIVSKVKDNFSKADALTTEQLTQLTYLKQLRQQILSDAMQGKLDVSYAGGESGADLLACIQKEKAKTVKKAKPLSEIKADDIPFAIPEHWVWCRLGEVVEMSRGKFSIRPRNDPRYFNGIYPFIQIGSLDEKGSVIYEASQSLNEEGKRVSKEFPKGTIVIAIVGGTIGNLGVLGIDMCFTDSMVGIYPSELYNQEYVLNFLRYVQPEIKKAAYQMAGQPNIKIPTLTELIFPLPPLSEQAAIVHKIDSLMTHCDELEASIRKNQEYTQMLYQTSLREALQQPAK